MKASPLLLTNISQLLTVRGTAKPRRGPELNDVGIIEDAAVLCAGGKIVAVGPTKDALKDPAVKKLKRKLTEFDCAGRVVLPGFVDSHTHPAFTAPRLVDFEKRISGASYEEIAAAGGGIRSSVDALRKSSPADLTGSVLRAFNQMAAQGTTTVEAKSGYGLSTESEVKSLEAIRSAAARWPGTVVSTLLAAHVVPKEHAGKPDKYVDEIVKKMLPLVKKRNLAQFVDVFIERGAFTLAQAERIFEAAERAGLGVRAHVCQLSPSELWPLLRFQPTSFDHMDHVNGEDIPQLARRDIVATLVPGANYFLGLREYPPARKLIDAGVAVALATDYNPGTSPTASMPFVLSLACTQMKMTPAEAIAAATINGAHALRLATSKGTIEPGKDADLAIFDVQDYREIPYWFGTSSCTTTVIGVEIFDAKELSPHHGGTELTEKKPKREILRVLRASVVKRELTD
ncbi:MAG: imidazolonepropionase [Candidatus Koribacter versatilis]|uniref:Imidazolonepropionase n=1 Tax=Candidatus Korobacter versatilis TaxID=658062 RepID=A0A932EP77_9BACT|nr:imidazolonepropionase [Candidatus Koribacter versatilis]